MKPVGNLLESVIGVFVSVQQRFTTPPLKWARSCSRRRRTSCSLFSLWSYLFVIYCISSCFLCHSDCSITNFYFLLISIVLNQTIIAYTVCIGNVMEFRHPTCFPSEFWKFAAIFFVMSLVRMYVCISVSPGLIPYYVMCVRNINTIIYYNANIFRVIKIPKRERERANRRPLSIVVRPREWTLFSSGDLRLFFFRLFTSLYFLAWVCGWDFILLLRMHICMYGNSGAHYYTQRCPKSMCFSS